MAKQTVNIGVTANDNTGDPLRTAFDKLNDNFDEVYAAGPVGTNIQISDNVIASTNTNGDIDLDPAGTGKVVLNGPTEAKSTLSLESTVTGNITPTANVTYNIGSDSAAYSSIHGNVLHIGSLILREVDTQLEIFRGDNSTNAILSGNSTTAGSVLNNGNTVVSLTQNGPITFFANNYQDGNATVTVINSGNITSPAVVATGSVTGGSLTDGTATISSGALTGVTTITASGNVTGGNISATGLAGTLSTAAQPNVTSLGTLTSLDVTGNVTGGNLVTSADVTTATVTASGNVTANNATVTNDTQTATVTFSGDSTEQNTAYKPIFYALTSNGSAIGNVNTNAFGASANLQANSHYEVMAHVIASNDSTGNITIELESTAGDTTDFYMQLNSQQIGGGFADSRSFSNGQLSVTTNMNATQTYHIQFTGSFKTVSAGEFRFKIGTTAGNVTPLAGSNFRFIEYSSNSVGDIV